MKTAYKLGLLVFLLPLLSFGFSPLGAFQKKKEISKAYAVNSNAIAAIENSYGSVTVHTWNQDKIQIEVVITVSADDEKWVNERINAIDVEFQPFVHQVSATTKFKKVRNLRGNNSMQVRYTVYIPANGGMNIKQQYGNVTGNDFSGPVKVEVQYGRLQLGKLNGSASFDLQYVTKAEIESMKVGNINAAFSKLKLGNFQTLKVNADYTDLDVDSGNNLSVVASFGDYNLKDVKVLTLTGDYVKLQLNKLTTGKITSDYGRIQISELLGNCVIEGDYAKITATLSDRIAFSITGDYLSQKIDGSLQPKSQSKGTAKVITGGSDSSDKKLEIKGDFNTITLNKL